MSKQYVVVDWGTWGIDVQLSTKIVVKDLNFKKGDACSLQGTDPVSKRSVMFEGEVLGVFGTKKDADKMVTALVSPPISETEKEPAADAPRPRRQPKPSKKKQAELENHDCEEPERKTARKESGVEKGDDNEDLQQKQAEKEPEMSQKKKSASGKKRKAANSKNDEDSEIISVANKQRVQNLLVQRQQGSCSEVNVPIIEIEEETEVNKTRPHPALIQPNLIPQPSDDTPSAVPKEQIISKLQPQPTDAAKSRKSVPSEQYQPVDHTFQQSSQYKPASPVTPVSGFQFSSPSMGSTYSASTSPSLSRSSMSSPRQFVNSREVMLSPPGIPQQEFSISESLSHCYDYDVSDLEIPLGYSSHHNTNLHQLETVRRHVPRDDSWQGMQPSLSNVNKPCPNCQPLLQSLNSRLNNLEAEVEKLRRKQRKGKVLPVSENEEKENPNEERFNGLTKETLIKSIEDASDAKGAVEGLAKKLFTTDELQSSSVTGFQCNKAYESRPGLSPSRRSLLENIILKRNFSSATRSTVRKDLGVLLKKARANKTKQ